MSHKSAGPFVPAVPNGTMPILVVITMSTAPSFGSAVSSVTKRHARVGLNSYQRVPFHDQTSDESAHTATNPCFEIIAFQVELFLKSQFQRLFSINYFRFLLPTKANNFNYKETSVSLS